MSKNLIKYIVIYIIAIITTIIMCLGQYPLSFMILILSIITIIIILKIKYPKDGKRYIVFGFIWSLSCLIIFLVFIMLATKVELIRRIMIYTI